MMKYSQRNKKGDTHMAYNTEKPVKLAALKALAEKVNDGFATQKEVEALSGRVDDLVVAGGEPNVLNGVKVNGAALSIAEKMVDILIAAGSANGTLAVNGTDVAVKGLAALAYKAQVSESDLDSALTAVLAAKAAKADVDTLIGSDTGKSVPPPMRSWPPSSSLRAPRSLWTLWPRSPHGFRSIPMTQPP